MSTNLEEGCLSAIVSLVLLILIIAVGALFNYFECHSKAEKQGYECSWGPIQGCMIKQKDGTWIDYDRLCIMD